MNLKKLGKEISRPLEFPNNPKLDQWEKNREQIADELAIQSLTETMREQQEEKERIKELDNWHAQSKNGNYRLITGALAEHLAANKPAMYSTGRFYIYDNGVYKIAEYDEEKALIMDHIRIECRTINRINDVSRQWAVNSKVQVKPEEINKDPYILNLKSGLYDIRTGTHKPHTPHFKSTVQLKCNYDPDAKGERFGQFINEVVPDEQVQLVVQEIFGYSITMFTNAQKMFVLTGKSDTGKSTFLNIIQDLLGSENISNMMLQKISDRFNTAELFGKTANIFADLPKIPLNDDNILKAVTGQDPIRGERKGQAGFSFYNKAKLIFSCNSLPENYGDKSQAFYNRFIILPFDEQIPEEKQDPELQEKLRDELDYIFLWAMQGLNRLIANNFIFTSTEKTKQLISEYQKADNSVLLFLDEICELAPDYYAGSVELFKRYKKYCEANEYRPLSSHKFIDEVLKSNPTIKKDTNVRINETERAYKGIRIKGKRTYE